MAIWDNSAVGAKCSNCAGNLFFDEHFQKMSCRSCGSFFEPGDLAFAYQLKVMDTEKASEDDTRVEFVCDSCGAVVITDDTTVADICAFCGSPVIAKRRLVNEFKPDYVIPFKIDKNEAQERFITWAKQYKKAPKDFSSSGTVSTMKGVYVPFWLVDAECCFDYEEKYNMRTRDVTIRRVPFDGSEKIPDGLMHAIEPYDYDEMVPYSDGYLHGFFANRYDKPLVDMTYKVHRRFNRYLESLFNTATDDTVFKENMSLVSSISQAYALLPVWFLNYEYDGQKYQYAINGQTGEVQGFDVPYSKFYYGMAFAKKNTPRVIASAVTSLAVIIFAIVAFCALMFATDTADGVKIFTGLFAIIIGICIFLDKVVYKKAEDAMQKPVYHVIDDIPDVSEYLDVSSIKEVHFSQKNQSDDV